MIQQAIDRLRQLPDVRVEDGPSSWTIQLTSIPGFQVRVDVPHDVLEWFVTVRDATTDSEVWSDWNDYAGYVAKKAENPTALADEMRTDIEWFVRTLRRATGFRVTTQRFLAVFRHRIAEWCLDGHWQLMSMAPPSQQS